MLRVFSQPTPQLMPKISHEMSYGSEVVLYWFLEFFSSLLPRVADMYVQLP